MLGKLKSRVQFFFAPLAKLYTSKTQKIQAYLTDLNLSYTLWHSVVTGHCVMSGALRVSQCPAKGSALAKDGQMTNCRNEP